MGDDAAQRAVSHAGPQGLPHRPHAARTRRPAVRRRADRLGLLAVASGPPNPKANTQRIADTFRQACDIAEEFGERLAAEGEICWGGMHSAQRMVELLEAVDRPKTLGFQADMAHTLLFLMGYNAPEDRLLPADFEWDDTAAFDAAYEQLTDALRPWTIDFHVAQNNGEVFGSGSHDKTGRHCLPNAADGKLDIVKYAGYWLRDEHGKPTKRFQPHLLGRLHVPERNAHEAAARGTTSWRRWSPCAMRMAGASNDSTTRHGVSRRGREAQRNYMYSASSVPLS